jgi:hypothetical protein
MHLQYVGRLLLTVGILLVIVGLVTTFLGKIPGLGKLPGDFYIKRGNFTFYFPLATSIILSLLLSLVINLIMRR